MARLNILIGEILLDRGLLSKQDLESVLKEQALTGDTLGQIVIRRGLVAEGDLRQALSEQLGIAFLSFEDIRSKIDFRLNKMIPQEMAIREIILPLEIINDQLKVASARIPSHVLSEKLKTLTGLSIKFVLGNETDILKLISDFYRQAPCAHLSLPDGVVLPPVQRVENVQPESVKKPHLIDFSVEEYLRSLLSRAVADSARDIHFERNDQEVSVRYRLDGVLYELPPPPPVSATSFFLNLKNFFKLEKSDKVKISSAAYIFQHQDRQWNLHVSAIPLISGESIVIEIPDTSAQRRTIKMLGLDDSQSPLFEEKIQKPHGLMIVAGPKGSGKSTTLYAGLMRRVSQKTNILTIEDPVKFRVAGINQVSVQADVGLTFAAGLRAFLRQDPDVILVGEMGDPETAEICVRAALTGHLVMSVLHVHDVESVIMRLLDMGIKPYLIAGSLFFIVSQRLVRCLCPHCKKVDLMDQSTRSRFAIMAPVVYRASEEGCENCRHTGYSGQTLVCELFQMDEGLRAAITSGIRSKILEQIQADKSRVTLFRSAIRKVEQGLTSMEELKRLSLFPEERGFSQDNPTP